MAKPLEPRSAGMVAVLGALWLAGLIGICFVLPSELSGKLCFPKRELRLPLVLGGAQRLRKERKGKLSSVFVFVAPSLLRLASE